ncbi:GDSL esterase/lipase At1g23500-like [Rhodamnia argentea]|uniref:GDSL esterase/lipase At1g23500-like n=1 Tax=Rhodamnia argentea TaxID=178133 RepID=A0A8B8QJX3_9MYRT|nr:GDSL esterase/lipase At1g23500-like [Rhodamnia argentea]
MSLVAFLDGGKNLSWLCLISLLLLLLLRASSKVVFATKNGGNATYPALFAFGDSILDTGNNNNLRTLSKCNYPPYGRDFPGAVPTGRFGDGKVLSDLITEGLGIKELLPAYLDPNLKDVDLPTGVCFASGGSGLDPLTAGTQGVLAMEDQLKQFNEYVGKLNAVVGAENATAILNSSLYLMSAGNNDIAFTYLSAHLRPMTFPEYADFLVISTSTFIRGLYALGARRFALLSALPLGCLPSGRAPVGGLLCSELANQAAQLFNSKLSAMSSSLTGELTDSRIVYINVYDPLLNLIRNPNQFGFRVANVGCCGVLTLLCNGLSPFTCPNVPDFVFWDAAHPSEKAYRALAPAIVQACSNM